MRAQRHCVLVLLSYGRQRDFWDMAGQSIGETLYAAFAKYAVEIDGESSAQGHRQHIPISTGPGPALQGALAAAVSIPPTAGAHGPGRPHHHVRKSLYKTVLADREKRLADTQRQLFLESKKKMALKARRPVPLLLMDDYAFLLDGPTSQPPSGAASATSSHESTGYGL